MGENESEKNLRIAKRFGKKATEDALKKEIESMTLAQREVYNLEVTNLKLSNRKLKNEWWHLLIALIIGSALTIGSNKVTEWLNAKESQKEVLKNNDTVFVKELIHTNQKDTLKMK